MSCPIQDEIRSRRGKELNELLDLDYSVKKRLARMIIHNALQKHKDAFVSCSFGRDSIVLLHLVKTLTDRVKVIHCNTGIEFRENLDLMHYLTEEWNLVTYSLKPRKTFWQCVREYGYPKPVRGQTHGTPHCCYYLKEAPTIKFLRYFRNPLDFVGITGDEGRARRWTYIVKGSFYYFCRSYNIHKCTPLLFWTKEDISAYTQEYGLPESEAYQKYGLERTGCKWCTGHLDWERQVSRLNERVFFKIMHDMGQTTLDNF